MTRSSSSNISSKSNSSLKSNSSGKFFRDCRNDEKLFWTDEMEDLLTLRLATPIHGGKSRDVDDRDESSEETSLYMMKII